MLKSKKLVYIVSGGLLLCFFCGAVHAVAARNDSTQSVEVTTLPVPGDPAHSRPFFIVGAVKRLFNREPKQTVVRTWLKPVNAPSRYEEVVSRRAEPAHVATRGEQGSRHGYTPNRYSTGNAAQPVQRYASIKTHPLNEGTVATRQANQQTVAHARVAVPRTTEPTDDSLLARMSTSKQTPLPKSQGGPFAVVQPATTKPEVHLTPQRRADVAAALAKVSEKANSREQRPDVASALAKASEKAYTLQRPHAGTPIPSAKPRTANAVATTGADAGQLHPTRPEMSSVPTSTKPQSQPKVENKNQVENRNDVVARARLTQPVATASDSEVKKVEHEVARPKNTGLTFASNRYAQSGSFLNPGEEGLRVKEVSKKGSLRDQLAEVPAETLWPSAAKYGEPTPVKPVAAAPVTRKQRSSNQESSRQAAPVAATPRDESWPKVASPSKNPVMTVGATAPEVVQAKASSPAVERATRPAAVDSTPTQRTAKYDAIQAQQCLQVILQSGSDKERQEAMERLAHMENWQQNRLIPAVLTKVAMTEYNTRIRYLSVQMLSTLVEEPELALETLKISAEFDSNASIRALAQAALKRIGNSSS